MMLAPTSSLTLATASNAVGVITTSGPLSSTSSIASSEPDSAATSTVPDESPKRRAATILFEQRRSVGVVDAIRSVGVTPCRPLH
ncbi:hypothetical protein Tcan_18731 [Toxocara canis]|uniref:Uncharacterized protein n=1 Tax=Toxocara canis TaxID=6265 RepID=A0A0B2W2C8_TOXCA|nr:hypothetical protein Tcan_18731 [Toxocara canis]